jgi:hypothetical protein
MAELENDDVTGLILKCELPKPMSYYTAQDQDGEVKLARFEEFSRHLRDTHGPDFLNAEQRSELFNSVCSQNVRSHLDIVVAYRKFAEVLVKLHEKRTKSEGEGV